MQEIDTVTFFSESLPRILQRHFEKFNLALAHQVDENQHIVRFMIARHLDDDRAELEFIRKICEYLLRILLPQNYALSDEFIYLIREVLTNHVIFNVIDYICDPYFINHQATVYGSVVGPVASTIENHLAAAAAAAANLENASSGSSSYPQQSMNSPGYLIEEDDEPKEDISDSIYDLVCEIFVLKKAQHFIRRTIITDRKSVV